MRILIASKFFYPRGGAEIVAINTRRILMDRGHDVRVLAMSYPENISMREQASFPGEVNLFGSLSDKIKGAKRSLGMGDVKNAVRTALDEFKPDVVHLHNVHTYLSPLIAREAKKRGIRVVWTLHDYKLFCPAYSCRRPDGTICEECVSNKFGILRHRCMKGSFTSSLMGWLEARRWNKKLLEKVTDKYIAPSAFMASKMINAGYRPDKIEVVCNFIDPDKLAAMQAVQTADTRERYICYIGRLSQEKGVETLLEAAAQANVRLKLAGRGPLLDELKAKYAGSPNIEFLGHLGATEIAQLLSGAVASVMPSECYENNPLGVIESLSIGTPVIGSQAGGIPELIVEGRDGFTYPSGDVQALAHAINRAMTTSFNREEIARNASGRFGIEQHYECLIRIYNS
ncbi:MAG: glycosyltransferase [Prevotella sp.]|nr:glycosyltransferase [Prevotella sp.]MCM1074342.1 glycosyltransferase [Ruminococcus sp.]